MKKYRSKWSSYAFDIEEIEVERETPKFVVFKTGIRETKHSNDWWNYFDLFGEAKQYLIDKQNNRHKCLQKALAKSSDQSSKIKEIVKANQSQED